MSIDAHAKTPRTDTRQRILDVAAHLFAARGYAGTSIRDIADELGVTKAALYYHFSSKEVLLQQIVAQPIVAIAEVMEAPRDLTSPAERNRFVQDVIVAMSMCDSDVIAVFKDPGLAPIIDGSLSTTGVTHALSVRLAMGLSHTDDPDKTEPQHLMRAIAAVGAGYEAVRNWHVAFPECDHFEEKDLEVIAGFVSDVLEAPGT